MDHIFVQLAYNRPSLRSPEFDKYGARATADSHRTFSSRFRYVASSGWSAASYLSCERAALAKGTGAHNCRNQGCCQRELW